MITTHFCLSSVYWRLPSRVCQAPSALTVGVFVGIGVRFRSRSRKRCDDLSRSLSRKGMTATTQTTRTTRFPYLLLDPADDSAAAAPSGTSRDYVVSCADGYCGGYDKNHDAGPRDGLRTTFATLLRRSAGGSSDRAPRTPEWT